MILPKIVYRGQVWGYGGLGAFVDGSGVVIGFPFALSLAHIGESMTVTVPEGAVNLSLGATDHGWGDNIGSWTLDVSGASAEVTGKTRPWDSSANPTMAFGEGGSTSPVTTPVTPGTSVVITYLGHTVQIGSGFPFTAPIGVVGAGVDPSGPAPYAIGFATLNFTYPPIGKPGVYEEEAIRADTDTLSGLRTSVYERTDDFFTLNMDWVPIQDMPAWSAFMASALTGSIFFYFPDATQPGFTVFTLEDTRWKPSFNFSGIAKFSLRFRKVVGPDQTGS